MANLSDCKKGMYIINENGFKVRIRKVNKFSVTVNQKVNYGTGMLCRTSSPHFRVIRENELNEYWSIAND